MLDHRWRTGVERGLRPFGARLRRAGFTADQITLLGLAASLFTGIAIATGDFFLAAVGMATCGLTDVLDGAVAKAEGTAGPRGAFFDSVSDRVSDGLVLGGAAWYLSGTQPRLSVLAFAVAGLSFLVSYLRSKAEGLGLDGRGGLMERAERMVILGLGLAVGALVPALWLLLVLTSVTVIQRFAKIWSQAPAPARPAESERLGGWWLTPGPERSEDSRLARWRSALRPPGERVPREERGRFARWLLSPRPPRPGDRGFGEKAETTRWGRWRLGSDSGENGVRSQLRRLRGRSRP